MIKEKFKTGHFVILIWLIVILSRYDILLQTVILLTDSISLFFSEKDFLFSHIQLNFLDSLLSLFIMLLIPFTFLNSFIRKKLYGKKLNFSYAFLILILYCFFIPSLIIRTHPDFQNNIAETKLLPPLSFVYDVELNPETGIVNRSDKEKFLIAKSIVLLKEFDDNIISTTSFEKKEDKVYLKNGSGTITLPVRKVKKIHSQIHLFGTDEFGRDILSRLIFGARISVFIGFTAIMISLILGLLLGFFASTQNQILASLLNRFADLFLAFPSIFFVVLVLALFGNNLLSVIVVLGFSGWMSLYKIVSSEVASVKQKDFYIVSQKIGLSNIELLFKEILPVIMIPVTVNLVFQFSNVILAESALSFLGLGSGSEYPSWGAMIEKGQEYINVAWWMIIIPGSALVLTLLSIHNIAKEVNKYFNPKIS